MPQAGEDKDDYDVQIMPPRRTAAAAEGKVDVIPEPAGHRDMPAPPEIIEAAGLKGGLEVLNQVIAQYAGRAQGNVTAAGEIHVQLHGKQHGGGGQVGAAHIGGIAVDHPDIEGQVVGNDHLFGVAPQHTERAARAAAVAEATAFLYLRAHLGVALNRAVNQSREKADKQRIVQRVQLHPAAPLVDVDGVTHRGKGEVAQSQRGQQIVAVGQNTSAHGVR